MNKLAILFITCVLATSCVNFDRASNTTNYYEYNMLITCMNFFFPFFFLSHHSIICGCVMVIGPCFFKARSLVGLVMIHDPSTNNSIALRSHYYCKIPLFNSNYSRIMLQSSGHLATERPLFYLILYLILLIKNKATAVNTANSSSECPESPKISWTK